MDLIGMVITVILNLVNAFFILSSIRLYALCFLARRYKKKIEEFSKKPSPLERKPFVSIMIPTYNERNVVDRILEACVNIDYDNYEIVVVDDSTDETVSILRRWARHPRVKVIHRPHRHGWKGGALDEGLKHLDPRSEFVLVFDADFIPPRDIIKRLLSRFTDEKIAAVQGYHLAVLNADENWVTRAGRMVLTYGYAIDYPARFAMGGAPQLGGSVMMIRRGVLERVGGFGTSITEDYDLTLRLYINGYRIVYDEGVKVPCECPSTLKRFAKQQSRWIEGRMRDFRRRVWGVLRSKHLSLVQKLDIIIDGLMNLAAFIVLMWLVASLAAWVMGVSVPLVVSIFMGAAGVTDWAQLVFWTFVGLSYPLAQFLALKREGVERGSTLKWIAAIMMVMYLILPFTSLASLRGVFLSTGYYYRTYKTGKVLLKRALKPAYWWRSGAIGAPYTGWAVGQPFVGVLGWPISIKCL